MRIIIPILVIIVSAISCSDSSRNQSAGVIKRDTAITTSNAFSELFFDSLQLENFIQQKQLDDSTAVNLRDFYNVRNYQFAWFDSGQLNEQAHHFWNLQGNYITYVRDSSFYNPFLQTFFDSISVAIDTVQLSSATMLKPELELTMQFFRYAARAYQGRDDINPKELKWFIPRRKVDILSLLDSMVKKGDQLGEYQPLNRQYRLLRENLQKYSVIAERGGWDSIVPEKNSLKAGDSMPSVAIIKRRLQFTDDYNANDTSVIFNDSLVEAVKRFQIRFGLIPDGVVGGNTLRKMNEPLKERIRQLLINIERMKWLPVEPEQDYILVNIPEYRLHIYERGRYAFNMKVVVGTMQHSTVIFTGKLKHVVFSPYWNVPPGILKNEVLPGIRKNANYLTRHNMEWHNGYVRQKPGPNNSLGLVKFLFPNSYNIYLHDTPSKSLFNENKRAFSHGCIRVAEPKKLAEWILRNDSTWNSQSITEAMNAGREKFVNVREDVTVFIGYFTAWVDRTGKLNFREDIYGHDKELGRKMFND